MIDIIKHYQEPYINNKLCNNYNDKRKKCIIEQKFNHFCVYHHICQNCDKLKHLSYKYPDTFSSPKTSISNKICNPSNWLITTKPIHHEFTNEFLYEKPIILNTISNSRSHTNLITSNIISNMKYFIINSITLDISLNIEYSIIS